MKFLDSLLLFLGSIELLVALWFLSANEYLWAVLQFIIASVFFFGAFYAKNNAKQGD